MKILLTNDDGIQARGLLEARSALLAVPGVEVAVIAPDSNRSATARSITTRTPLWVEEVDFEDGSTGFATDGTPVDCVRFATLGLLDWDPELIVSGINHGANLGDDITYSGTVAAAFEGIVLGLPAIAISQQARRGHMDFRGGGPYDFAAAASFLGRLVEALAGDDQPGFFPPGTLLNVNCPALAPGEVRGAEVTRLGKRIYRDRLELTDEETAGGRARRRYRIYGDDPSYHQEEGSDFAAIAAGKVSLTPIHFDLTDTKGMETLSALDLERLLRPAEGTPDQPAAPARAGRSER